MNSVIEQKKLQEILDRSHRSIEGLCIKDGTVWICIKTYFQEEIKQLADNLRQELGVRKLKLRFITAANAVYMDVLNGQKVERKYRTRRTKEVRVPI